MGSDERERELIAEVQSLLSRRRGAAACFRDNRVVSLSPQHIAAYFSHSQWPGVQFGAKWPAWDYDLELHGGAEKFELIWPPRDWARLFVTQLAEAMTGLRNLPPADSHGTTWIVTDLVAQPRS